MGAADPEQTGALALLALLSRASPQSRERGAGGAQPAPLSISRGMSSIPMLMPTGIHAATRRVLLPQLELLCS